MTTSDKGFLAGFEDGGIFPLAPRYSASTVGNSNDHISERLTPELPEALINDDATGDGVFADLPNTNLSYGMFADNLSMPGYAARENGFGPSDTIDWQTGTPVAVFASGINNNVADAGVFPTARGPEYVPNRLDLADTDFEVNQVPTQPIYSNPEVFATPVTHKNDQTARGTQDAQAEIAMQGFHGGFGQWGRGANRAAFRNQQYGAYGESPSMGWTTHDLLASRQMVPQGRIGILDLIQRPAVYPPEAYASYVPGANAAPEKSLGEFSLAALSGVPVWQMAAGGVFVGALVGALLAVFLPKGR